MRNIILFAGFILFFNCSIFGQGDSLDQTSGIESISTATVKAKEISIDLTDPEDVDLALKKIHTFRYLESVILEGEVDENILKKLLYRLSVLKNLTSITLKENELNKIPENIANIKTLQSLTVEGNSNLDYNDLCSKLKNVPLNQLNLIDNDLKKAPTSISEISTLKKVQLSGSNQLDYADLVEQLAKLPGLTTLSIPVNYITELPKNIDKLRSLQILDVSNNNLIELPEEISGLKAINNLSIQGNLLLDPAKDLEKLKGNNIQYLSLDKEIAGEDLEQIKKMFPGAQIDFPVNKEDQDETSDENKKTNEVKTEPAKQVYSGELKAKKESSILSGAYLLYPALFQSLAYNFDTLNFEERYKDLRYENVYQIVNNRAWRGRTFYFRKNTLNYEKPGKKNETWFFFPLNDQSVTTNYPELRAFSGMYWVYKGDLTKKQFKRKYLINKQRPINRNIFGCKKRKRKMTIRWNDIRIDFDKNNSLFTIHVKSDTNFSEFMAYPIIADAPVEKSQQTYNRRFLIYQKSLLRRSQNFKRDQLRNKSRYDSNFKKMNEYSWKELQLRMSNEEKEMSKEEWLQYYDDIIANEQKAIDNSSLSIAYILRGLVLRGYNASGNNNVRPIQNNTVSNGYGYKTFNVDFVDSKDGEKLAVSNIMILDNKNKSISQINGTLGLSPNFITIQQFSSYSILVELRNGNWGVVSAEEIDKQAFAPNKTFQFNTLMFDKNLDTIGNLLKAGIK